MEKKYDIYLHAPWQSGREEKYVREALDNNWLTTDGEQVEIFEGQLKKFLQVEGSILLTNSGTSALHLAIKVLDISEGDVVICPSFTFVASVNPILYEKATPAFVDSEKDTWNMDPEMLEEAVQFYLGKGKKPKAIIVVHAYGMPAKMQEIKDISEKYDIPIIEDAAEALGSAYDNKKAGTLGDISIFSFNGNKIVTTTSGGAFISQRTEWVEKARLLANQYKDPAEEYLHTGVGFNYKMSNICAAVGRAQMDNLKERLTIKEEIHQSYRGLLSGHEVISFQKGIKNSKTNHWLTCLTLENESVRNRIITRLNKERIESRPLWKPMHHQKYLSKFDYFGLDNCEILRKTGLVLPSGLNISKNVTEKISFYINSELNN